MFVSDQSMVSVAMAVPIIHSKMGVGMDSCYRSSTQRPTSLLFSSCCSSSRTAGQQQLLNDVTEGKALDSNTRRSNKTKRRTSGSARIKKFLDVYESTGEMLGEGSFGYVTAYRNKQTNKEVAVKVIRKSLEKSRKRVLKEIEIFHHCQGHDNILQMIEYFEEDDHFYLVFEKMEGGTLLDCILGRGHLTEREASRVVRDVASGLDFLHKKGIAHRDLKPENILCVRSGQLTPVKICDFDLGSEVRLGTRHCTPITTPELVSPVGSADFMAPEVVDVWQDEAWSYDKRCDLWSLGIILYILLCGRRPFYAHCGDSDCGFEEGEPCEYCQEALFSSIRQGDYDFPPEDWDHISYEAKDLIRHLLVKNPYQRFTAAQVLSHTWVSQQHSLTTLVTPQSLLSRNNSVRELGVFAETANAVNRLIQQHMSISQACSPSFSPSLPLIGQDCSNMTSLPSEALPTSFDNDDDDTDDGISRQTDDEDDVLDDEMIRGMLMMTLAGSGGGVPCFNSRQVGTSMARCLSETSEGFVDSGNVSAGSSPPGNCGGPPRPDVTMTTVPLQ